MLQSLLVKQSQSNKTPRYIVSDCAPNTFGDVYRTYSETKTIVVWSGGSNKTIFGTEHNWLFRAWHDWAHIRSGIGFTPAEEIQTALFQMSEIESTCLQRVVWIEVAEQAMYFARTGLFVDDQIDFFGSLAQW